MQTSPQQDEQPQRVSSSTLLKQKLATATPSTKTAAATKRPYLTKRQQPGQVETLAQRQRPKTARQGVQEELPMDDPLVRASERHGFTDIDNEMNHLRQEAAIFKQKALITDDIKNQNETLQQ